MWSIQYLMEMVERNGGTTGNGGKGQVRALNLNSPSPLERVMGWWWDRPSCRMLPIGTLMPGGAESEGLRADRLVAVPAVLYEQVRDNAPL